MERLYTEPTCSCMRCSHGATYLICKTVDGDGEENTGLFDDSVRNLLSELCRLFEDFDIGHLGHLTVCYVPIDPSEMEVEEAEFKALVEQLRPYLPESLNALDQKD